MLYNIKSVNKKLILITFCVILVFGIFLAARERFVNKDGAKTAVKSATTVSQEEINENIKKYQPQESDRTQNKGLDVSAVSAIVVDENTNEIIYEKGPKLERSPASITKIATVSVVLENLKKDQLVTISEKAADQEPNKIVMKKGEKMKVDDLLYGLMMISANDAAYALAEAIPGGYDRFIELMNEKVKFLGLTNTKFTNPSGLDETGHYSSAFDIATLTRYAILEHPEITKYAGKKEDFSVYPTDHNESHWWSHISHMLYAYPGMIAAKTGYTDIAKSTYIGIAQRNGRKLTVVLMGATDANGDVKKLLDFGFAH